MKAHRIFPLILLLGLLGATLLSGMLGLQQRRHDRIERQREAVVRDMVDRIHLENQAHFVVDASDFAVSGEDEYEESSDTRLPDRSVAATNGANVWDIGAASDDSSFSENESENEYVLSVYGTISIPSIDCELPLLDGAGVVELRYGAGRMPLSADAGEFGNLVIFGHRMKRYGSLFNRLGEVECGNSIFVSRGSASYEYVIDEVLTISPSEISRYIQNEGDSSRITLVTCTPIGVGSHRLILRGHLLANQ